MATVYIDNDGIRVELHENRVAICMYCKFVTVYLQNMYDHLETKAHIKNKKKFPERLKDKQLMIELGKKYNF